MGLTDEQRKTINNGLGRHGLAILESKVFDDMKSAAEHFNFVVNDLGFAASTLTGSGPFFVFACDEAKPK